MRDTSEMYAIASRYRGEIINEVSWLERFLDGYIAKHFVGNNHLLLGEMHLLFLGDNRVSLENKRQIFFEIAKVHDLKWFQKYSSIRFVSDGNKGKKKRPNLNVDLGFIIEKRNVLAHRVVDTSANGREEYEKIGFCTYKNVFDTVDFSEQSFSELYHVIKNVTEYLSDRIK